MPLIAILSEIAFRDREYHVLEPAETLKAATSRAATKRIDIYGEYPQR